MPTGKIKFFDSDKGFGFVTSDEGDAFLHSSTLPEGMEDIKTGTRVEYSVVDGKRGSQVMTLTVLDATAAGMHKERKSAEDMAILTEDLIKLLDEVNQGFRAGRYPERSHGKKVATVLRAVAKDLDS